MDKNAPIKRAAVILAAGQGTRMKSPLAKVLHPVGGRSMLDRAIDAAIDLGCERVIVVVGNHSPLVREAALKRVPETDIVTQDPPLGTAHAVNAAREVLSDFDGQVIVTYADCPLMSAEVLAPVFVRAADCDMAVMAFVARDAGAYGRMIVEGGDDLLSIVEAKEATPQQLKVNLCNSGVLACDRALLFSLLAEVKNENAKGEYYLTDVVGLARARGLAPKVVMGHEDDVLGVNSQAERAVAEAIWQGRAREKHMQNGVMMTAPETVFLSFDTRIEAGVTLEPNIVFGPKVVIKSGAHIKAFSHLEGAVVHEGAHIGPFARLRPGADIGQNAHIGNFVEVKNVTMGAGAKANHLSYLGDGAVGPRANIGAGTIFCNYDGFFKYKTIIGEGAFIGSNASLVAPVTVGAGAMTASGSVITEDVPDGALAIGRAGQTIKEDWAAAFRAAKASEKAAKK
jgi:bifunctional UDP-N-acetylglucosamine pyrophosphorylase/glucosamine-1-phosphate N-acetyltransferase